MASGNYVFLKKLKSGGMGDVHLAARHDAESDFSKLLCIKTLRSDLKNTDALEQWFLDEAKIVSRLNHRNIAQVLDFGKSGNEFFLVSEYCEGLSLDDIIKKLAAKKEVLDKSISIFIILELLEGLAYAHGARDRFSNEPLGLVHRDLSPGNLMITFSGETKIIDFGVARNSNLATEKKKLVVGKSSYMSPEQASRKGVDRRSDIYTVGVILWELLTFKKLFWGETKQDIIKKVQSGISSKKFKDILVFDEELNSILRKALAAHPDSRYDNCAEFYSDLNSYVKSKGISSSTMEIRQFLQTHFRDDYDSHQKQISHLLESHKAELNSKVKFNVSANKSSPEESTDDFAGTRSSVFNFGDGEHSSAEGIQSANNFSAPLETLRPDKEIFAAASGSITQADNSASAASFSMGTKSASDKELKIHNSITLDNETLKEESTLSIDFDNSDPDVSFFRGFKHKRGFINLRVLSYATITFLITSSIAAIWYFTSFNPVDGIIFASRECQKTPFTRHCLNKKIVVGNPNTWIGSSPDIREPAALDKASQKSSK